MFFGRTISVAVSLLAILVAGVLSNVVFPYQQFLGGKLKDAFGRMLT